MLGNTVVAMRINDSSTSTATITVASAFSHVRLRHGPSTSRSLHSSSKNTLADGRSTPASACTASVITPRGAPGISTIAAAPAISPAKMP